MRRTVGLQLNGKFTRFGGEADVLHVAAGRKIDNSNRSLQPMMGRPQAQRCIRRGKETRNLKFNDREIGAGLSCQCHIPISCPRHTIFLSGKRCDSLINTTDRHKAETVPKPPRVESDRRIYSSGRDSLAVRSTTFHPRVATM